MTNNKIEKMNLAGLFFFFFDKRFSFYAYNIIRRQHNVVSCQPIS